MDCAFLNIQFVVLQDKLSLKGMLGNQLENFFRQDFFQRKYLNRKAHWNKQPSLRI